MSEKQNIKLIECPRDAMQGIQGFIPTKTKAKYINSLLKVNFDTIDFGSFVSPKAIPQMRDTAQVLSLLDLSRSTSKLLAIVANERGAKQAIEFEQITYLGFPFSVSPSFQQRNTNASQQEAFERIENIQELCIRHNKKLVVYISMAFGNPYGDLWNVEEIEVWVNRFSQIEIPIIALADTVGVAQPEAIGQLFGNLVPRYDAIEFGAHFHSRPNEWKEKIEAAYQAGCLRFDSTLQGIGGCPMAKDELVGNIATENLLSYFNKKQIAIQTNHLENAQTIAQEIF